MQTIALEFAKFRINLKHQLIEDLGEFSVFCLKTISEGCSLEDISKITLLNKEFIYSQLSFIRDRKYITEDNQITEKGRRIVNILNFLEKYRSSIEFYTDHYIDNPDYKKPIPLNLIDNLSKKPSAKNIYIEQLIKPYRLTNMLNKENFKEKLIKFIIEEAPDYKDLIEEEKENLLIEAKHIESKKAILEFEEEKLLQSTSFVKEKGLTFAIPVITLETKCSVISNNKKVKEKFQKWYDANYHILKKKVYNLIDGSQIEAPFEFKIKVEDKIPALVRKLNFDSLNIYEEDVIISGEIFPYMIIEKHIQEGYATGYISEKKFSEILEEAIFNRGSV